MTYVDNSENQNFERAQIETPMHNTKPTPKNYHRKLPTCIVCSMEEGVMRRAKVYLKKRKALL